MQFLVAWRAWGWWDLGAVSTSSIFCFSSLGMARVGGAGPLFWLGRVLWDTANVYTERLCCV